jgi:hypothetical protein
MSRAIAKSGTVTVALALRPRVYRCWYPAQTFHISAEVLHGNLVENGVMLVSDQSNVIAFLKDRLTSQGTQVEVISTHASLIFLAGDRAFKLKRAVRYPYLDFSTPEKRFASCQAEVEFNRRTAPHLYIGVQTITSPWPGTAP